MPGEGSVFQRSDGRWVAQLSTGGREDRRYVKRIRATRRLALSALDELRQEQRSGVVPSKQSLGSYLRSWLDESVVKNVSPNTARGYDDAIAHFDPIAHIALIDLRAEHIEATANRMRAHRYMGKTRPMTDLGPASPKTVRNALLMLRSALEQAHERGHVRRNEAKLVKLPKIRRIRRPALTPETARAILQAIAGDRYEAAYALAMSALRESEVLGLTRADVDAEAGIVTIRHQLRGSGKGAKLAPTKTEGSAETVELPEFVADRLRAHIAKHDPVKMIFTTERGYGVNGSWFTKHFQALLAAAGLERMTVHDLRAGASTLLAAAGTHPKLAQDFLRHADVRTTLTDYTRTTAGQRSETARILHRVVTEGVTGQLAKRGEPWSGEPS